MSFEVDFSPIGNLAKTYNEARTKSVRERTLAELGQHFANGNIDYRGLAAKLFAIGEGRPALTALQSAELRDARAAVPWPQSVQPAASARVPNAQAAPQPNAPPVRPFAGSMPLLGTVPPGMPWAADVQRGADGHLYARDPNRPGQYLKVTSDGDI
jgi:hypothetical protein